MGVFIESKYRISLPKYTVFVWRSELPEYKHEPKGFEALDTIAHKNQDLPMEELGRLLVQEESVSQVEILDWDQRGIVLYSIWP